MPFVGEAGRVSGSPEPPVSNPLQNNANPPCSTAFAGRRGVVRQVLRSTRASLSSRVRSPRRRTGSLPSDVPGPACRPAVSGLPSNRSGCWVPGPRRNVFRRAAEDTKFLVKVALIGPARYCESLTKTLWTQTVHSCCRIHPVRPPRESPWRAPEPTKWHTCCSS